MVLGHQLEPDPDLGFGQVQSRELVYLTCMLYDLVVHSNPPGAATGGILGYMFGNRGK